MSSKIQRDKTIDLLKGFGIILMVLGHMHFDDIYFAKYIFGFHMPLFFVVSGYLYNSKWNLKDTIYRKAKSLLAPYFLFGGVYYLIYLIVDPSDPEKMDALLSLLVRGVTGLKIESALWFLPSMFLTIVIYKIVDTIIRTNQTKAIVLIILSVVGCLSPVYVGVRLPWGLDSSLAALIFFYSGIVIRRKDTLERIYVWKEKKFSLVLFFLCLCINGFLIMINGDLNMRLAHWGIIPLTYFNGIVGTVLYWILALAASKNTVVAKWVCRISEASIVYLCTNHLFIRYAERLFDLIGDRLDFNSFFVKEVFVFFATMIGIYILAEIIMRTPIRILLGKR